MWEDYIHYIIPIKGSRNIYPKRFARTFSKNFVTKAECIITDEQNGVLEIKNLAVKPEYQRKGYGKVMIDFIIKNYKEKYSILQVGTGDSTLTIPFYEQCGFIRSHYIKNFFMLQCKSC